MTKKTGSYPIIRDLPGRVTGSRRFFREKFEPCLGRGAARINERLWGCVLKEAKRHSLALDATFFSPKSGWKRANSIGYNFHSIGYNPVLSQVPTYCFLKTIGTIIGRIPLTETGLIVQWCTADEGIVKTVAKGARRPKSPFAGKIDLFYRCEIEVYESTRSDLHRLNEIAVLDTRMGLRRSYRQTLGASYFVKLIELAAEPATPIPELDDLLTRGLDYLDKTDINLKAVVHFEKQMAEILGVLSPQQPPHFSLCEQLPKFPIAQRRELVEKWGG